MSRENDNLHDTAALRSLAGGFDLQSSGSAVAELVDRPMRKPPKIPRAVDSADALGSILNGPAAIPVKPPVHEKGSVEDPLSLLGGHVKPKAATPKEAARVNKARVEKMAQQQAHHFSLQFRKTAIPLLFGMSGVLALMGAVTLWVRSDRGPEDILDNPLLQHANLFATVAFILAAVLVAGAMLFQLEIKRAQRNTPNTLKKR